jgi:Predicted redox protein, regulator of disulfide bond formation
MTDDIAFELDARGLLCPLPVLRANKKLRTMSAGAQLRVIATDPSAPADFAQFCVATGHHLVERTEHGDEFHIVIRRAG